MGGSATVELNKGYPVLVNDHELTDYLVSTLAEKVIPAENLVEKEPTMGGEDFAFYAREIPACFFYMGTLPHDADKPLGLHQSDFDFNDDVIPLGIRCFCEAVVNFQ